MSLLLALVYCFDQLALVGSRSNILLYTFLKSLFLLSGLGNKPELIAWTGFSERWDAVPKPVKFAYLGLSTTMSSLARLLLRALLSG